jgi:hypothetical protein
MTELRAEHSQTLQVSNTQERLKFLILDVRTRWFSTHVMLGNVSIYVQVSFTF